MTKKEESITYKDTGVDIHKGNEFVKKLPSIVNSTFDKNVINGIGDFAALYSIENEQLKNPVLVSACDGVGTKIEITVRRVDVKNELKFETDIKYNVFGPVHPWDRENDNTRENLRKAMAQNPFLKVFIQSGYYDGATNYFQAKYTMWQVDPSGKMKDRFYFEGYRSGHMMYLRSEDIKKSNDDLRDFIKNSSTNGMPAKY